MDLQPKIGGGQVAAEDGYISCHRGLECITYSGMYGGTSDEANVGWGVKGVGGA